MNTSNAPESSEVEDWEYKMISTPTAQGVLNQANEFGADGWEMVSIVQVTHPNALCAFFKR